MKIDNVKRYYYAITGFILIAFGVSIQINSTIGLGSWDALSGNLSMATPLTFGTWVYIVGLLLILLSGFISKERPHIMSLLNSFIVGVLIDVFLLIESFIEYQPTDLINWILFFVGLVFVAIGVAFSIKSNYLISPIELLPLAIKNRFNIEYRYAKVLTESFAAFLAVTVAYVSGFGLGQIGVGTIVSTLLIGFVISFFFRLIPDIKNNTD